MKKINVSKNSGFTLIELSMVMIIIGLLAVAGLQAYGLYSKRQQIETTSDNIKAVQAALQKYQDDHGFYPCPADPTDKLGHATNCADPAPPGIKVVTAANGQKVRIGAVPLVDLDRTTKIASAWQAQDGWKHRLTYAVTESMAINEMLFHAGNGGITVKEGDNGADTVSNVNIVVLSHGEDGAGAYTSDGVLVSACPTNSKDAENCNGDDIFLSAKRSYALGTNYNDDYIDFNTATAVETTKACEAGAVLRGLKSNGDLICTKDMACPENQAFVGFMPDNVTPKCALVTANCTDGSVLVGMKMGESPKCIRNMPGNCPAGYVQNGTVADVDAPNFGEPNCIEILNSCPANYVQVGTQVNHQPICVANFNSQCSGGQIQVGNDGNGSAICSAVNLSACPPGQYLYGMNNGAPLCSGDRTVNDNVCPGNQVVTGISNGNVICGVAPTPASNVVTELGIQCYGGWYAVGIDSFVGTYEEFQDHGMNSAGAGPIVVVPHPGPGVKTFLYPKCAQFPQNNPN